MKTPAARVRLAYCAALWISLADRWAEELISGDNPQRPAQTQRLCFSWGGEHNQGYQRRGNVTGIYYQWEKNSTYSGRHRGTRSKLEFHLNWRRGRDTRTSKLKQHTALIIHRILRAKNYRREGCWISPWKDLTRPLILKPQTSRNGGYLVSWPLVAPRRPSESCPTFHAGLCVASIFHTSDNAPQPRAATLIFVVYCSRLRDSARHSKLCISVISTGSILACTADRQPNTEVMNKSQYSINEPGGGLFIWCIFGNLGWILNQIQRPASRCIIQSRFKKKKKKITAGTATICRFISAIGKERHRTEQNMSTVLCNK